jgi:hypothetical protein
MAYNIYLSSNTITPFLIVNDNTIDNTSTSIEFIGRQKIGYGQAQDQSFLWMLENFSNSSPPTVPLLGQLWFDSINDIIKVNVGTQVSPIWRAVGLPTANATGPSSPDDGQLWFDTVNQVLKAWNGTVWVVIGPSQSAAPIAYYEQNYSLNITTDATPTELWKSGTVNSRMVIPNNTTWYFECQISARRIDSGVEFAGWKIKGVINNTSGNVTLAVAPAIETVGMYPGAAYSVNATADVPHASLDIFVTGQVGKTVSWTCITALIKAQ